jgi:hypothetical protein
VHLVTTPTPTDTHVTPTRCCQPHTHTHQHRHAQQEIVCRTIEGPVTISNYADLNRRAKLCALALSHLGVG